MDFDIYDYNIIHIITELVFHWKTKFEIEIKYLKVSSLSLSS